jgi:hypothetical protein
MDEAGWGMGKLVFFSSCVVVIEGKLHVYYNTTTHLNEKGSPCTN